MTFNYLTDGYYCKFCNRWQLMSKIEMGKNLHQIIIGIRKNLKKQFLNISFEGLAKIKINL